MQIKEYRLVLDSQTHARYVQIARAHGLSLRAFFNRANEELAERLEREQKGKKNER